jgi:Flp pilus assembly protein TadG
MKLIRQNDRHDAKRYSARSKRTGSAAVEFALSVPIIFLFFIGAIEITQLNFLRHTASNAAYEGARKAIVPGGTANDARAEALSLLSAMGIANGSTATVNQTATSVEVTVVVPASSNTWGLSTFSAGKQVTQTCRLQRESSE